jgi:hypothetical protein
MRHLKTFEADYSEENVRDMVTDLGQIGASDWEGWWITEIFKYSDGMDSGAYALIGDSWKTLILMMLESKALEDNADEFEGVSSWEEFFQILSDEIEDPYDSVDREFKAIKMTPGVLKNTIAACSLLETGAVLQLGRKYFSNFDSAIMKG